MEVLRLRDDLVWREADGEVLALDGESVNYVSTNATGLMLWRMLLPGTSRDELVARLVGEFEIGASRAERDVSVFVEELAANGLLST